jgi:hypothetical protein
MRKSQRDGDAPREAPERLLENERERGKAPMPPPGPHADPRLTNPDATPGAGAMSNPDKQDGEADGGTG